MPVIHVPYDICGGVGGGEGREVVNALHYDCLCTLS